MNPFFQKIIVDAVLRQKKQEIPAKKDLSPYEVAKAYHEFKITAVDFVRDIIFYIIRDLVCCFWA